MEAIALIKLSCDVIAQIIDVAKRAQIHKDICKAFAKYLHEIKETLEIMTSELKDDPVTKNPLKNLKSLLDESHVLVDSCKTIKVWDVLGGGIADTLKEKQSAIQRSMTSFPCYLFVVAQKRERRKEKKQDKLKAINSYQALLKENITNYEESWSVCGPMLEKRPLWLATKFHLDSATRERLFHEHVDGLHKRCVGDYRSLLAKVITMEEATKHFENGENILSSWSKAKRLLENHKRYMDMPKVEREKLLREHVDGLHQHCVGEYRSLLAEVITLDAATKHFEDGENIISSWSKAKHLLATRQRYKDMPKGEREKLLREHVDGLHKRCVGDYRSLLAKVITMEEATKHFENGENILSSWSEAKRLLANRQRYMDMPKAEREKLLREHVDGLHKHCVGEYRLLLGEVITLDAATKHFENGENILSSWDKAKVLLETRERYKKMPKGEREKLLREHVNRLHKLCVQDYRILLKEVITVDAATKHRKNGNKSLASWSEAKGLLKQHQRYTRMPKEEAETMLLG